MLPLFEDAEPPRRRELAQCLQRLAQERVWIGTSSWKYEGWLGQIYTAERYLVRGKFSQKRFQDECLAEYAETFPIVCGDFSFYQFPSDTYWRRLFGSAPATLRFAFKVPEEITCRKFPAHARYGPRAGTANESFLNAALFADAFLAPLDSYRQRITLLIFEFGATSASLREFLEGLDRFLSGIPKDWRYSVEVRNPAFLRQPYFDCLRSHGVAHVFNAWTRMPELPVQIRIAPAFTTNFTVTRALLRQGRPYEQAVAKFTPYREITDPNPAARDAMRALIGRAREQREEVFIFVNNRLEGNAPGTIEAIVD